MNPTTAHPQEIEVKLTYSDRAKITNWLKQNGFELVKQKEIKDSYFSLNNSVSMTDINSFCRIRDVVGIYTELTLKDNFREKMVLKQKGRLMSKLITQKE